MKIVYITEEQQNIFDYLMPETEEERKEKFFALGGVYEGLPIGAVRAKISNERAVLDWVYVAEPYRKRGFGRLLVQKLCSILEKNRVEYVEFDAVLKEEGIRSFFEKSGFILSSEPDVFFANKKVSMEQSSVVRLFSQKSRRDIMKMSDFSEIHLRRFEAYIGRSELGNHALKGAGVLGDCSFASMKEKEIQGGLIASGYGTDLCIDLVYSESRDTAVLLELLGSVFDYIKEKGSWVERVLFYAANDKIVSIAKHILGDCLESIPGPVHGLNWLGEEKAEV